MSDADAFAAAEPVRRHLSTATGSEHLRAARDQLAAVLALDDESDEKMPPSQRCYIAGTLTALRWVGDGSPG